MLSEQPLLEKLRANSLLTGIDHASLRQLSGSLDVVKYQSGDMIFEQGDSGDRLFLILSGDVVISNAIHGGKQLTLGILHEGSFFGELDMIDGLRRSARATAESECTFATLKHPEFHAMLLGDHVFTRNLLGTLSRRLRASNLTYAQHEETNVLELHRQLEKMHTLVEASKAVNSSIDIDRLLEIILEIAIRSVGADRGTLYLLDPRTHELWSKVLQGTTTVEIRLAVGKGLAGTVAAINQTINISDAYRDDRFNPEIDQSTGYHTKSVLCMPMRNRDGVVIGVFQLLNKTAGVFSAEDEAFIEALSAHASIAIENAQLAQRTIQSERLSAVGSMASSIIHDIKNPMGIVRLSAQIIKGKSRDREVTTLATQMVREVDRFVAMTQEILDFSRGVGALTIRTIDLNSTVEGQITLMEPEFSRRAIRLRKDLQFNGTIRADADKLSRAFYNIMGNSAEAMPDGGTMTIRTYSRDHVAVIEFSDTGPGIRPDVRGKLFQPFATSGKKHGTGLGLAIVKKIVDDHKGSIEVESESGRGTTIRISLPA